MCVSATYLVLGYRGIRDPCRQVIDDVLEVFKDVHASTYVYGSVPTPRIPPSRPQEPRNGAISSVPTWRQRSVCLVMEGG